MYIRQKIKVKFSVTGSKQSPIKRNAKKAKWLSEEALQITVKRREAKSKGEKQDIPI